MGKLRTANKRHKRAMAALHASKTPAVETTKTSVAAEKVAQ